MQRIDKACARLGSNGIGTYLITDISDIYYLTGFTGSTAYLIIGEDKPLFITDGRYDSQAKDQIPEEVDTLIIEKSYSDELKKSLEDKNTIWVQPDCPLMLYNELEADGRAVVIDSDDHIKKLRMVKDKDEIRELKKAFQVAGAAFEASLEDFRPGRSESEWAALLEYNMKLRGAKYPSFETIVASGPRGALPHGTAGSRVIGSDEAVVVDYGAKLNYCSDITRMVLTGENKKAMEIIDIVYSALQYAADKVAPGVKCCEVDGAAREYIDKKGYGRYFNHGLGHGVGIDVHEAPAFNKRDETVLKEGMVLTIEPGIYLPDELGVRLEDTVCVDENGCFNLTAVLDKYFYIV